MSTQRKNIALFTALAAVAALPTGAMPRREREFTSTDDAPEPTKRFNMATRRYEKIDRDTPADLARKAKAEEKRAWRRARNLRTLPSSQEPTV